MSKSFLDAVYKGKNRWQAYYWCLLLIVIYWWLLSGYVALTCQTIFTAFFGHTDAGFFVASFAPFIFLLVILILCVGRIHHRSFYSLVNADASIDFKRLASGFGIWSLQLFAFTGLDVLGNRASYTYTFEPREWFIVLPFALILIPIQASTEELLYRGYLTQGLSLLTKNRLILISVISLAFALPHFANPEMQRGFVWMALTYFAWGVFFAAITLKDEGLELAIGAHVANNLSCLFVNTSDSAISLPTMLMFEGSIDPRASFFFLLIQFGIFYTIFFGGIPRKREKS